MKNLEDIQKRFEEATEKEQWEKLKMLLFSEDKENVVMGMSLIEQIDEEVYYDGVCTFLKDDGSGNWTLNPDLGCENDLALKVEILRLAEEDIEHEIKEGFEKGCLDKMLLSVYGKIAFGELSESQKERLLSKVCEMVEIKGEEGNFLAMKYQVTQALWESVTGDNPSRFKGASLPVEQVSWFDCVIFANKWSEKEGLEKVYEFPEEMEKDCKNQTKWLDRSLKEYVDQVKVNEAANGYRMPKGEEWKYAGRGGEDYTFAGSNSPSEVSWYCENSDEKTQVVGQKKSNGYGLYDMSGNVYEWCFDLPSDNSSIRYGWGGGWDSPEYDSAVYFNFRGFPSARYFDVGIRFFRSVR